MQKILFFSHFFWQRILINLHSSCTLQSVYFFFLFLRSTNLANLDMCYCRISLLSLFEIFKPEDCKEKDGPLSKAGICQDGLSSELLLAQYSKLFQDEDPFYDYAYGKGN